MVVLLVDSGMVEWIVVIGKSKKKKKNEEICSFEFYENSLVQKYL